MCAAEVVPRPSKAIHYPHPSSSSKPRWSYLLRGTNDPSLLPSRAHLTPFCPHTITIKSLSMNSNDKSRSFARSEQDQLAAIATEAALIAAKASPQHYASSPSSNKMWIKDMMGLTPAEKKDMQVICDALERSADALMQGNLDRDTTDVKAKPGPASDPRHTKPSEPYESSQLKPAQEEASVAIMDSFDMTEDVAARAKLFARQAYHKAVLRELDADEAKDAASPKYEAKKITISMKGWRAVQRTMLSSLIELDDAKLAIPERDKELADLRSQLEQLHSGNGRHSHRLSHSHPSTSRTASHSVGAAPKDKDIAERDEEPPASSSDDDQYTELEAEFFRRMRAGMGIKKGEPLPAFPNSLAEWPRAPPTEEQRARYAHEHPPLDASLAQGDPLLRLDWSRDVDYPPTAAFINKTVEAILADPERYQLSPERRDVQKCVRACQAAWNQVKRTFWHEIGTFKQR